VANLEIGAFHAHFLVVERVWYICAILQKAPMASAFSYCEAVSGCLFDGSNLRKHGARRTPRGLLARQQRPVRR